MSCRKRLRAFMRQSVVCVDSGRIREGAQAELSISDAVQGTMAKTCED